MVRIAQFQFSEPAHIGKIFLENIHENPTILTLSLGLHPFLYSMSPIGNLQGTIERIKPPSMLMGLIELTAVKGRIVPDDIPPDNHHLQMEESLVPENILGVCLLLYLSHIFSIPLALFVSFGVLEIETREHIVTVSDFIKELIEHTHNDTVGFHELLYVSLHIIHTLYDTELRESVP